MLGASNTAQQGRFINADAEFSSSGAAKESNLPTRGLHGPAGFEVRGFLGTLAARGSAAVLSVR
jgi:hypothetical protein